MRKHKKEELISIVALNFSSDMKIGVYVCLVLHRYGVLFQMYKNRLYFQLKIIVCDIYFYSFYCILHYKPYKYKHKNAQHILLFTYSTSQMELALCALVV